MDLRHNLARKNFEGGLNCTQSVLKAFANELNFDDNQALKIAAGFGGGLAHNGKVCGAVSGAIMVLGLKYFTPEDNTAENKELLNNKINTFLETFRDEFGSLDCKEILGGISLMTEEGRAEAGKRDLRNKTCTPLVESTAKIISEL